MPKPAPRGLHRDSISLHPVPFTALASVMMCGSGSPLRSISGRPPSLTNGSRFAPMSRFHSAKVSSGILDEAFLFAQTIDATSYERQRDRLREELTLAQIDLCSAKIYAATGSSR
jgi:hypothetical protein